MLREIMTDLKENGDLLIDEVDKVLSPINEMIFPQGPKVPISSDAIKMVREVIEYHLAGDDPLGLLENKQASYGVDLYRHDVLPGVYDKFFANHPELAAFRKYITGEEIIYWI
jgi:hypothetical protein